MTLRQLSHQEDLAIFLEFVDNKLDEIIESVEADGAMYFREDRGYSLLSIVLVLREVMQDIINYRHVWACRETLWPLYRWVETAEFKCMLEIGVPA